ncbi:MULTISPECIES: (2,3-dihydroxybenzoyl)adenylate synthase [Gordonia]|uniref:Enterobactin synthase subunit E n=2 Tax=Gordonia alkanivorans TaxID=84096 RepID=W9DE32_9ACTN|nr:MULTISPECIES: AMP-binding protein [Gordonia]ETA06649.1 enterobactin synthase subunit E [Gordonia alkanivorans CGMCC 6845]MDH3022235.1 AMP-binding protein [Gordonia alkanivorans]MDH3026100.1 AMP-binding protein [Gordonia alkanivorans]MDH3045613.1 AMP-binding protein [Gordonia alkanivorans]MDJ0007604.1 AMP-binding protein [Gordonia alkanivorans]
MPTPLDHATDLLDGFTPYADAQAARYRDAELFRGLPLFAGFDASAESTPDAPAVTDASIDGPRTLTYSELREASLRRAAGFVAAGLRPGERVVLQQNNSLEFVVNLLGLLRARVAPVMTLPAHRITEIAHLAAGAGAVAYIGEDGRRGFDFRDLATELQSRVPAVTQVFVSGDPGPFATAPDADPASVDLPASPNSDLPALFLVSGGTTGLPKLIARTHDDYDLNARLSAEVAKLTADDTYLVALPAAHNFPLCCPGILGVFGVGGHVVFTDNPSPDNTFDLIERHRVTVTALVPALAQLWCAATEWEPADISSLRLLQVGGAKLAHPDAVALDEALGDVVQQVFGMAEGLICYTRPDEPRNLVHEVQGSPMSEFDEVRVVDEEGVDVPDGEEGELLVRGPYTIRGYYRADAHNEKSFTPDGFYRSGDKVTRLPSGHLSVTGRIKDTIVRAGENVAADDVEENLLAHPSVRQVAVVGLPDDALGEKICAAVVLSHDHPPAQPLELATLRMFLADRGLASFKLPDVVRVIRTLPVTAVGKIDKKVLREQLVSTAG